MSSYYERNKDEINRKSREYYQKNLEENRRKRREYNQKHREKLSEGAKQWRQDNRAQCLEHYSGGDVKCNCCAEDAEQFMCIDHIDGGGSEHRKTLKIGIYRWLITNDFPEGFQVLCHNCNLAKGFYGKCPHEANSTK